MCLSWERHKSLDGIGDRLMFRLAYRKFADGHEAVVGNYSVSSGGVAGVRWFELRAVTTAPAVFQQSTYQPDTTWRWMGSVAMDQSGDLALGFSASSATINPQIRYAGRLVTDPINTLAQGEAHLFDGTGSQTSGNRWGDYSAMTIDPVDDCTFWYTQEYYATNGGILEDPHRELQVPDLHGGSNLTDSDTYTNSYRYRYGYGYSYGHSYTCGDTYANTDTYSGGNRLLTYSDNRHDCDQLHSAGDNLRDQSRG